MQRIASAIDLLCTAREIESLAVFASAKMGIYGVDDDSGNALSYDAALVGPHHVFQQKGEPALHRHVVGLDLVEAADMPHQFELVVDRVREQQHPAAARCPF